MKGSLERAVRDRAGHLCEYCGLPETLSELRFVLDHIIARQHGGATAGDNLAFRCVFCNRHKEPNLAGVDPVTRTMTPLFHPRQDRWQEHFQWDGVRLGGRTAAGRVTIQVLAMNHPFELSARQALGAEGTLPPTRGESVRIPLQLLDYHTMVLRGCNVDKPRNRGGTESRPLLRVLVRG